MHRPIDLYGIPIGGYDLLGLPRVKACRDAKADSHLARSHVEAGFRIALNTHKSGRARIHSGLRRSQWSAGPDIKAHARLIPVANHRRVRFALDPCLSARDVERTERLMCVDVRWLRIQELLP